jgi:hypothetical protein
MLRALQLSFPRWSTNHHYVYFYLRHSLHQCSACFIYLDLTKLYKNKTVVFAFILLLLFPNSVPVSSSELHSSTVCTLPLQQYTTV